MDHSYEKDTFTDVGISPGESDNLPTATEVPQEDENGPTNSFENVLPLDKLKKGWFTLSAMVMETAAVAQTKATEAYNSEQFQTMKQRTTEVVVPAWERTVEVATPIWEKTKATASVALETTKEKVAVAAEQIRPTVETVSSQVSVAAAEGWKNFSQAATAAADYTSEAVSKLANNMNEHQGNNHNEEYSASAMDSATRGGPMTL